MTRKRSYTNNERDNEADTDSNDDSDDVQGRDDNQVEDIANNNVNNSNNYAATANRRYGLPPLSTMPTPMPMASAAPDFASHVTRIRRAKDAKKRLPMNALKTAPGAGVTTTTMGMHYGTKPGHF